MDKHPDDGVWGHLPCLDSPDDLCRPMVSTRQAYPSLCFDATDGIFYPEASQLFIAQLPHWTGLLWILRMHPAPDCRFQIAGTDIPNPRVELLDRGHAWVSRSSEMTPLVISSLDAPENAVG
jgi:hypothetical protein